MKWLLVLVLLSAQAPRYTTSFTATENPISDSGQWINGKAVGIDWADVQTLPGLAFGTTLPVQYADPTAVLIGSWASDQEAQGTIRVLSSVTQCCHEVEIRLRTTITAHSITGYEINCSVGNRYLQIVRWNGPLNSFAYVNTLSRGCKDGDILKAKMIGNVITVYINDVPVLQATDSTFTSGSPGIGFYDSADENWNQFGFANFTAQNSKIKN